MFFQYLQQYLTFKLSDVKLSVKKFYEYLHQHQPTALVTQQQKQDFSEPLLHLLDVYDFQ